MTYSLTCTCGHEMTVEADSRDEGVQKMKDMMTQDALDAHWADKHQDDTNPKVTLEESHAQIEAGLQEVAAQA